MKNRTLRRCNVRKAAGTTESLPEAIAGRKNVNEWFAENTANAARERDTDAARLILVDFIAAIDARSRSAWPSLGPPVHWLYARYIADAFRRILAGEDPAVALGLKAAKAGRPHGVRTHDDTVLAADYWFLIRKGFKPEHAIREIGNRTGADRTTIQRARKSHEKFGDSSWFTEDDLTDLLKPHRALIKEILAAERRR